MAAQQPRVGGLLSALAELVVSIGGYYALRAVGVDAFWSLVAPGFGVALVAVIATVRRRRIDLVGLLVLFEVAASLALVLITRDPRVAAVRGPVYVAIGGLFCLATLLRERPMTAVSTASLASFGDPVRAAAFETAWREEPRYRLAMRAQTGAIGLILIIGSAVQADVLYSYPLSEVTRAIDIANVANTGMWVAAVVATAGLMAPARRIVLSVAGRSHDQGA
ncbi:VC0807 family protein [Kutzneria sp. NPDC052558]|uniref:VC0807 family protein n=1 Tax=Kutzneria sp. NPDC052558 TaxID=3364121 RepID=UPI0037C9C98A